MSLKCIFSNQSMQNSRNGRNGLPALFIVDRVQQQGSEIVLSQGVEELHVILQL